MEKIRTNVTEGKMNVAGQMRADAEHFRGATRRALLRHAKALEADVLRALRIETRRMGRA